MDHTDGDASGLLGKIFTLTGRAAEAMTHLPGQDSLP